MEKKSKTNKKKWEKDLKKGKWTKNKWKPIDKMRILKLKNNVNKKTS